MKLSIITINYNNRAGLEKTMKSVFAQTFEGFEYIVIDGGSTDGSKELINNYSSKIDYWVSEKDRGIYHAMNKGIRASSGEYLLFLNSGDYLVDSNVVSNIINELDGTDIIQGNVIYKKNGEHFIHRGYGHSDITFLEAAHGEFPHQAMFTNKKLFEQNGYFDETYKVIADTVFFLKNLAFGNATFKYIDVNVAYFAPFGISQTQITLVNQEHNRMNSEFMSERLLQLCTIDEKKIALWEKLHNSRFLWIGTMCLVHIYDIFHKEQQRALVAKKDEKFIQ